MLSSSANQEIPQVSINVEIPRRLIRKVSPELRMKNKMLGGSSPYDPVMVSLGPHHHGKPELQQAEEFKKICLEQCLGDEDNKINDQEKLHNRILGRIDEVRNSYDEVALVNRHNNIYDNDDRLAHMMLLDACFIICYMEIRTAKPKDDEDMWSMWRYHLGDAGCHRFAERDIMVLENQIPLFVLELVMFAKYKTEEKGRDLVEMLLGWALYMKLGRRLKLPEPSPPHILAAFRLVLVGKKSYHSITKQHHENNYYTCGSVTDLKGKGIYFFGDHKSDSYFTLQDIEFKAHAFYGKIQLPVRYISDGTLVYFSNMIAYELCPQSGATDLIVCSYISLMKSLIQTPADVKELQEAGVFALNRFANQEHVVDMFKTFDTLDLENKKIYEDVMNTIGRHSKNKLKTWIAYDLIQTSLRSPCTTIAWLSAIIFFALTCVTAYYTIYPVGRNM